jgi:hypothetical protein
MRIDPLSLISAQAARAPLHPIAAKPAATVAPTPDTGQFETLSFRKAPDEVTAAPKLNSAAPRERAGSRLDVKI